ncbi:MAG: type II toxin-antitoxin system RelE/ParE family toxin [bacterium]
MKIRGFAHRGLERLFTRGDGRRLPPQCIDKLQKMLGFLQAMADVEELRSLPTWHPHMLVGTRSGVWSLMVTRNWRLTFRVDATECELFDLDFEDYH